MEITSSVVIKQVIALVSALIKNVCIYNISEDNSNTIFAGLFHQVIAESGSDVAPWAVNGPGQKPETYTQQVALQLGCPTHDSQAMMDCLRQVDPDELVNTAFNCTV